MAMAWRELLKKPATKIGLVTAMMFQLIFGLIWMTGYAGVTDRIDQLTVGIVNEDAQVGATLTEQLRGSLPTTTVTAANLAEAEKRLDSRELHMIVRIPADFTQQLSKPDGKGTIEYRINESNPAMIKSMMTSIAAQITASVNQMAVAQGTQAALAGLGVPGEQSGAMAQALSEKVTAQTISMHPVDSMSRQMVPLMLVLASFVGSMIMSMNVEQAAATLRGQIGKWQLFGARTLFNVLAAVVVSGVGAGLLTVLGADAVEGFWMLWLFEALMMLSFIFVSQLFLLAFGIPGMLFNIIALSVQLVSAGALVPRELLPEFFRQAGDVLPATYAAEGSMNLLFGGPSIANAALGLLAIGAVGLLAGAAAVALRRERAYDQRLSAETA